MRVSDYIKAKRSMADIYEYITEERFDTSVRGGHPEDEKEA